MPHVKRSFCLIPTPYSLECLTSRMELCVMRDSAKAGAGRKEGGDFNYRLENQPASPLFVLDFAGVVPLKPRDADEELIDSAGHF